MSELSGISVPTSQECIQNISEKFLIQNLRYPYICIIPVRKYANQQTDGHIKYSELFEYSVLTSQEYLRNNSENYLIQNLRYAYIYLISVRK